MIDENVVKDRDSTGRRVQALEVRSLRNLRNEILLCKHTSSKQTVEQRNCIQAWKRRQKQNDACLLRESYWKKRQKLFTVYVNNGSSAAKGCLSQGKQFKACWPEEDRQKGKWDTLLTHSHRTRRRRVINLRRTNAAHCTEITGKADQPLGKYVTQTPRSNTLLFTNTTRALVTALY